MKSNGRKLTIVRNMHPDEVTAFCLARDVTKILKSRLNHADMFTIPYEYSLCYMSDHAQNVIQSYYGNGNESLESEIKRLGPTKNQSKAWIQNLNCTRSDVMLDVLRKGDRNLKIVDFHNFPAGDCCFRRDEASRFSPVQYFSVNGYDGFLYSRSNNNYVVEIPALYKSVPREVLDRRMCVSDMMSPYKADYITKVVDYRRSSCAGLTGQRMAKSIARSIEFGV
jgi:hypothetical protein